MAASTLAVEVTARETVIDHAQRVDLHGLKTQVAGHAWLEFLARPAAAPSRLAHQGRISSKQPTTSNGLVQPGMRSRLRATYPYLLGGTWRRMVPA